MEEGEILMTKMQIYLNIACLIGTIIAVIYFVGRSKKKENNTWEKEQKRKIHNKFVRYNKNVFTRKRFRRIVMQYSSLSCYEVDKVKQESVKLFEKAILISVAMPLIALIAFRDVLLMLLVILVAYIYYDITVDKAIDKVYEEIIKEVSICIQSIRERYMESSNVANAVLNSDKGKYLLAPIQGIYDMLTAIDSEDSLYKFCRTTPVRLIKTLAMVCYITNERGDVRGDNNSSAFADQMTSLRQEADTEIRRLGKVKIAFKSLQGLTLAGLVATPLVDTFLMTQIPATATLIKGMFGFLQKTILILTTAAAYYYISICSRPTVVNTIDKVQWIDNLTKKKKVRSWLQNILPKKYKTRAKIKKLIQDAVSAKSMEYIYLSKIIYSIIFGICTFLLMIGFTITAKSYLWSTNKTMSFVNADLELTEKAKERLQAVDYYYMTQRPKLEDEEALAYLKARVPELSTMEQQNEIQRMSSKYDKYYSTGYKWYYTLIAIVVGVLGWFVPEISLYLRRTLVQFEEIEDVMQLQTMMLALSQTTMDVSEVLYWLERQSTIHKVPLSYALQEYASDPELALERLKFAVGSTDFKRLAAKLQTAVYTLSLSEAFSDMVLDKEQLLRIREMTQDEVIRSKQQNARLFANMPIAIMLTGGFVAPIIILGFTEILRAFSSLDI